MICYRYGSLTGILCGMLILLGCGSDRSIDAENLADAQSSYDAAVDAVDAGNSEEAIRLLDIALAPDGGLPPDISVDARLLRATEFARIGRYDDAHSDLDVAEQGAGDMSAVHATRAYVLKKEGKDKESKSEMSKARRLNSRVRSIKD